MPDLRPASDRPRDELISAIRDRTDCLDPSLRILAENILGAGSTIDLVAADSEGGLVLVMLGEEGEDQALLTRAIAQRSWVTPRVRDWIQLAPSLGLRADSPVRALLLCPTYSPETLAAAEAIGKQTIELSTYRWMQTGDSTRVLIESCASPRAQEALATRPDSGAPARRTAGDESTETRFRTGLTEEDLNLTPQEARDFD